MTSCAHFVLHSSSGGGGDNDDGDDDGVGKNRDLILLIANFLYISMENDDGQ